MGNMAMVQLSGNAGRDAEMRTLRDGKRVTVVDIGVNRRDKVTWYRLEFWDGIAEIAQKTIKKGDHVTAWGDLKHQEFPRNDGSMGFEIGCSVIRWENFAPAGRANMGTSPETTTPEKEKGKLLLEIEELKVKIENEIAAAATSNVGAPMGEARELEIIGENEDIPLTEGPPNNEKDEIIPF